MIELFEKVREAVREMELRCLEEIQRDNEDRERDRLKTHKEVLKVVDILSHTEMQVLRAEQELMEKNWE